MVLPTCTLPPFSRGGRRRRRRGNQKRFLMEICDNFSLSQIFSSLLQASKVMVKVGERRRSKRKTKEEDEKREMRVLDNWRRKKKKKKTMHN